MRNYSRRDINAQLEEELKAAEIFLTKSNQEIIKQVSENVYDSIRTSCAEVKITKEYKNDELFKYRKQLKNFGFPEFGNLTFETEDDKIAMLQFLEFIIRKKSLENEDRTKFKRQVNLNNLDRRVE
jgi:hypothetical protein